MEDKGCEQRIIKALSNKIVKLDKMITIRCDKLVLNNRPTFLYSKSNKNKIRYFTDKYGDWCGKDLDNDDVFTLRKKNLIKPIHPYLCPVNEDEFYLTKYTREISKYFKYYNYKRNFKILLNREVKNNIFTFILANRKSIISDLPIEIIDMILSNCRLVELMIE